MASVFLIGFMAAGKSAVGRELARILGRPFYDLDERIESNAERTISQIFAESGEAEFRRLEREALADVIATSATQEAIIATGGGAATQPENLEAMLACGLVVELSAPLETLLRRASGEAGAVRPLLARSAGEIEALYAARQPSYRRAHASVETSGQSAGEIAGRVAALESIATALGRRLSSSLICAVPGSPYPIATASGSLDDLGALLAAHAPTSSRVAVVSDSNVGPLYLPRASASLRAAGFDVVTEVIVAGESSKSSTEHARVAEALVGAGLDRRSVVVALGGGVVGDLAGYVAASLFRGVRVIQVPTSLVAMVDSAIGGKTGVNLEAGKNLLGAFWQPSAVLVDPRLLETLPERELRAGLGELFKYGLLAGEPLWQLIGEYAAAPREASAELTAEVIARCAGHKSWIVSRDAREQTGERALLNLGHTVGHAIERAAGYGEVLHGEAVALGLLAAARISRAIGVADVSLENRVHDALVAAGLDADLDPWLRVDVLDHIGVDKKRTGRHLSFVVVRDLGQVEIAQLSVSDIAKFLLAPSQL